MQIRKSEIEREREKRRGGGVMKNKCQQKLFYSLNVLFTFQVININFRRLLNIYPDSKVVLTIRAQCHQTFYATMEENQP
jgi:hypothetical protein